MVVLEVPRREHHVVISSATHDEVAFGTSSPSARSCTEGATRLLVSLQPQRFYPSPAFCAVSPPGVPQDRLSWRHSSVPRFCRTSRMPRTQQTSSLLHLVLCRAAAGKKRAFDLLLQESLSLAQMRGLIAEKPQAAIDATGLESRQTSRHYILRSGYKRFLRYQWVKLTVVCHTGSHLWAAAIVSKGPSNDSPQFPEAMRQASQQISWDRLL